MSITAKSLTQDEYFYGHKACAGCGGSLAVRSALKVLGKNAVAVLPAGCMSAVGFNFPQLCFANNAIISTFAGTASMLTGVEAGLRAKGKKDFTAVGFAGDGGTADIGIQALSGAIDRNDNILYIISEKLGFHCLILSGCLTDHHKLHLLRHHGECGHFPFHIFFIIFLRICQSHKVPKCPGHHVFPAFQASVSFLSGTQHSCNVSCHRRLFCNYQ